MEFNLFSFKVFREVVREGNFTRAARNLLMTQPAVTVKIQNLEQQLGCPLMVRNGSRGIHLTDAGRLVLQYAEEMAIRSERLLGDLKPWRQVDSEKITIGCCCIAGEYLLPEKISVFKQRRPNLEVNFYVTRCEKVLEDILLGHLQLGIIGLPPKQRQIAGELLVAVPLMAFEAAGDPPECGACSLQALKSRPLILREEGSGTRLAFQQFLRARNLKIESFEAISVSESNEAIKGMVARGLGWSILPRVVLEDFLQRGIIRAIELDEGQPAQEFYVAYRRRAPLQGGHLDFARFLLGREPSSRS